MAMIDSPEGEPLDRFEHSLRGFHPVAPRPLTVPRHSAPWRVLAVAAIVLAVLAFAVLEGPPTRSRERIRFGRVAAQPAVRHGYGSARPATLGQLNSALRASDKDFDHLLDDASSRLLPHEHRGTALFELSKE